MLIIYYSNNNDVEQITNYLTQAYNRSGVVGTYEDNCTMIHYNIIK